MPDPRRLKQDAWGAYSQGNFSGAIYMFRRAQESFGRSAPPKTELELIKGVMLCHSCLGDTQGALEAAEKGLALISEKGGEIDGAAKARFLHNCAVSYSKNEDHRRALELLKQALPDSDRGFRPKVIQGIGVTLAGLGRHARAVKEYDRALDGNPGPATKLFLMEHKSASLHALKEYGSAVKLLRETVRERERRQIPRDWTFFHLGSSLEASGNLEEALKYYKLAADSSDSLISHVQDSDYRKSFFRQKLEIFSRLVSLAMRLDRTPLAYSYARAAKGKVFREELLRNSSGSADLEAEKKLRTRMRKLVEGEFDPVQAERLGKRYRQVRERIREKGGVSGFLRDPLSVSEIKKTLRKNEALIDFYFLPGKLLIFISAKSGFRSFIADTGDGELEKTILGYRAALLGKGDPGNLNWISRRIYERILGEPLKGLKGVDTLLISPHRVLHLLPFGALRTPGNRHLAEEFIVFHVPSPLTLSCIRQRKKKNRKRTFLGVADPLGDLPEARRETLSLGRHFSSPEILKGGRATLPAVKRALPGKTNIHFACHGVFESLSPLDSHIKLRPLRKTPGELRASEITGINLKEAECAVLSACSTALGCGSPGDDWDGLSRSLLIAGARSALTALWDIPDSFTADFMESFYEHLSGMSPAAALREACLLSIEKGLHPFYWAAFRLSGNS